MKRAENVAQCEALGSIPNSEIHTLNMYRIKYYLGFQTSTEDVFPADKGDNCNAYVMYTFPTPLSF